MARSQQQPLIYFHSLELENVRCFGERQVLELTDEQGRLAQWTLLLGDNGVGKTTLLQCLAWMRPVPRVTKNEGEPDAIEPALNNEENNVLNSLLRMGPSVRLRRVCTSRESRGSFRTVN
jgi:ABC-type phosphate transport system ATPase subunit